MRQLTRIAITAALASAGVMAQAQPWTSALFPMVNGKYKIETVHFAGRDWRLDDYSYVGYSLGDRPLGAVPCTKVVTLTHGGDISAELQQAIAAAGNAGGGIVKIPAGNYTMSSAVAIPYDNVSIEGAGSGSTHIHVPANYNSHEGSDSAEALFTFGRKLNSHNAGWVDAGAVVTAVTRAVHRGDLFVHVEDSSDIGEGDWIVVQQRFWQALVEENSADPDKWPANSTRGHSSFSLSYLRRVTSKRGDLVLLDAPIPWDLDPANHEIVIRATDGNMHENAGLAGLSIEFEDNVDPRTGRPHGSAVYFEGVHDGWVFDVHVSNFPRYGIYTDFSARITVLDSTVTGAQDKGGSGYGYGFLADRSQNILFRRCTGRDNRHNFITSRALTSMVVMSRCTSANETQPDDTHFSFEQAILWDKHTQIDGGGLEALDRGDESGGAYETLASGVVWNFHGDGLKGQLPYGGAIYLKPSPSGQAIVAGLTGAHLVYDDSKGNTVSPFVRGQLVPAYDGLQVGSDPGALENVLYEGLYRPLLEPESLYEAQFENRAGHLPRGFRRACVPHL